MCAGERETLPLPRWDLLFCQSVVQDRNMRKWVDTKGLFIVLTEVTNFYFCSSSQFHRILENWLPGDIERNTWNISSPGSLSLWSVLNCLPAYFLPAVLPLSSFPDISECQSLKLTSVVLVLATWMENGQDFKGNLPLTSFLAASSPSRVLPGAALRTTVCLNTLLCYLLGTLPYCSSEGLFCAVATVLKRRFRGDLDKPHLISIPLIFHL